MLNLRRIGLFSMPLRAAFTLLFLVFSAAQPALFAASGTEGHGLAMRAASLASVSQEPIDHTHAGKHSHAIEHMHGAVPDDGQHGSNAAGKSCEVHCAPVHAMPVTCPEIAPIIARCFAPVASEPLPFGEYAVHIRPPKQLI